MSITEYERNQLFTWFEEHMGKERANVSLLPPVGWADVATKRDLDVLGERLDAKIDALASRMDTRFEALDYRFESIDRRFEAIDHRFESVDHRLDTFATKADLYEVRSDLQRTFVTWMFASQAAVVAAVGILLSLFH